MAGGPWCRLPSHGRAEPSRGMPSPVSPGRAGAHQRLPFPSPGRGLRCGRARRHGLTGATVGRRVFLSSPGSARLAHREPGPRRTGQGCARACFCSALGSARLYCSTRIAPLFGGKAVACSAAVAASLAARRGDRPAPLTLPRAQLQ